jgi:hypothetical protein
VDRVVASAGSFTDPSRFPLATPWGQADLHRLAWEDIFGTDVPPNSRAAAMSIPAVARARNLLCTTIAKFPLLELEVGTPTPPIDSPAWFTAAGPTPHQHRMVWTVDDLIFYGWSCWWRVNDPDTGLPAAAGRLEQDAWQINDDNRVEVDGIEVSDDAVILIPGFHEGILTYGRDALADARSLYRTVRSRLNAPIPPIDLHQTGGRALNATERQELIDIWIAARQSVKGAVGFSTPDIDVRVLEAGGDQLMIEERNAAAVEMARVVGVHAGMVDATAPKASLNYETSTGRNQEFTDFDLSLYVDPIAARLSMDDVTAPGRRVALDQADFTGPTPSGTGPTRQD